MFTFQLTTLMELFSWCRKLNQFIRQDHRRPTWKYQGATEYVQLTYKGLSKASISQWAPMLGNSTFIEVYERSECWCKSGKSNVKRDDARVCLLIHVCVWHDTWEFKAFHDTILQIVISNNLLNSTSYDNLNHNIRIIYGNIQYITTYDNQHYNTESEVLNTIFEKLTTYQNV